MNWSSLRPGILVMLHTSHYFAVFQLIADLSRWISRISGAPPRPCEFCIVHRIIQFEGSCRRTVSNQRVGIVVVFGEISRRKKTLTYSLALDV